jgi:DNA excision repair protein ERCC-1
VSPRQKGNPILTHIRTIPWEYSASIPCDFLLSPSTCCLFLQLKYHKLHPEYIYTRIRGLQGKYSLRLILVLVDIEAHEECLKELTKTSVVNNVTVLLSWSAHEAGRYLELYKSYEHSGATAIKGIQSSSYVDRLIGFVTTPRGINRADAVSLVSNFGTIRTAVNAENEEVGLVGGWGERKVTRWHAAVREPFRSRVATRKVLTLEQKSLEGSTGQRSGETRTGGSETFVHNIDDTGKLDTGKDLGAGVASSSAAIGIQNQQRGRPASPEVSDGVLAALSKLRKQ